MQKKNKHPHLFHRSQIGRAQRYIRLNAGKKLTLAAIAREAGSSSYHFARLFLAYTGETPFDFLRRIRMISALQMLTEDPEGSVTEIALSAGYETPSAFNKVFKKSLSMNPRDFRNLGQAERTELIYGLSKPRLSKETAMNLTSNFEIVTRPLAHYAFVERHGPFAEVAPPTWNDLFLLIGKVDHDRITGYLGLSTIDRSKTGEETMIYEAGLTFSSLPAKLPNGLKTKKIPEGKYARFVLTGPHGHVWPAFAQIFRTLSEKNVRLRPEYCIENYLNDPKVTPEAELLTELLVPIM